MLLAVCCLKAPASAQCDNQTQQPLLRGINPPSGTKNLLYTIVGERLDQVDRLRLVQGGNELAVSVETTNSNVTTFSIDMMDTPDDGPATLMLIPNNTACSSPSIVIELRKRGKSGREDSMMQLCSYRALKRGRGSI